MRIVQINAVYGYGSTGHTTEDMHKYLTHEGHESFVFWATKCTKEGLQDSHVIRVGNVIDHKIHAVMWRIFSNQGCNSKISTLALCRKLKKIHPDIVHLRNLHSNYIHLPTLLGFLERENIAVVLTLHDCWFFTGNCTYFTNFNNCEMWKLDKCANCPAAGSQIVKRQTKKQFIRKEQLFANISSLGVVGVSDWVSECSKQSLLQSAKIHRRIYNWIDTETFRPRNNGDQIRRKYGIKDGQAMILGVSERWIDRKGLNELLRMSEVMDDAIVLLVGGFGDLQSTDHLRFIGYTNNVDELAELYSAADVFVNPSRMETFGKTTAEALSCGTPVVAYDNTGTSELLSSDLGELVEDGDAGKLVEATVRVLTKGKSYYTNVCRKSAEERFDKKKLLREYVELYEELCPEV